MIWVRETAQAVRNEHQIPVVLIVCEDITAMKEAEMAFGDSEELKNQILRSSADCIRFWIWTGGYKYMNDAGQELLQIEHVAAYTGKPWSDFGRRRPRCRHGGAGSGQVR